MRDFPYQSTKDQLPSQADAAMEDRVIERTCRSEADVSKELEAELRKFGSRCVWHKEVWMVCWTHSLKDAADKLRIDYVIQLDDAPFLLGLEVKAAVMRSADLGRALFQCAQYAHGYIAPNIAENINPNWVGKPLKAVFLYLDIPPMPRHVVRHGTAAHRLYGPANVGFAFRTSRRFEFRLCADRFWCELYGFNKGAITNKVTRCGNGSFKP